MANDLHRYGIMVHVKGTSYEDDYWFTDNKRFQIREFSHEAAEAVLKILQHQWEMVILSESGGWTNNGK